jgi:hypothetical protein
MFRGTTFWIVWWLGACSSSAAPPVARVAPPEHRATIPAGHTLARARDLERAHGVPRDYRAAARIYSELCKEGRGDLEACAHLQSLVAAHRGIDRNAERMRRRSDVLCQRGVQEGCFARDDRSGTEACDGVYERCVWHDAEAPCGPGNWAACAGAVDDLGCTAHPTAACFDAATRRARHAVTTELIVPSAPAERVAALVSAASTLLAGCDDGDADACRWLAGREIPLGALCDAGDFGACHLRACQGDRDAARIDAAHPPYARGCLDATRALAAQTSHGPRSAPVDLVGVDLPPRSSSRRRWPGSRAASNSRI